jgi:hypothetical protein
MIVETSANRLYFVADYEDAALSHVYRGLRVKRTPGAFLVIGKKEEMVRKAGCRPVEIAAE